MTTLLRHVLQIFEEAETVVRLDALARELEIDPATLDNMIQHWVRKGRIRAVVDMPEGTACHGCGADGGCPFVVHLPRRYELIRLGSDPTLDKMICSKDIVQIIKG
jgi:hypothetical protein